MLDAQETKTNPNPNSKPNPNYDPKPTHTSPISPIKKCSQWKPLGRPELRWEAFMQPHIQQESALSCSPNPNNPNPNYDPKATHT